MRTLLALLIFATVVTGAEPPFYADKSNLLTVIGADGKPSPVPDLATWQKRREHILANMQKVMGPLPGAERKVPLDIKVISEDTLGNVVRKKITYAAEKGDRVPAYLLMPKNATGKLPAMLCLHQTTKIGKDEPAGLGERENLASGLHLARRGYVTLCPDYPTLGENETDSAKLGYTSTTMKAIWNHMRGIDLLQSLPEVDGERIGAIGHSLGGHNSLFVAAFDPRVKVAVSSCGFTSFPKYYAGNLKGWAGPRYMPTIETQYNLDPKKMPFDFSEILAVIAPRAIFVNAPIEDHNFEVSGVRDCEATARPVFDLHDAGRSLAIIYPPGKHNFLPSETVQAYTFIDRHLKPRAEFTRMMAHWAEYADDDYLKFIEKARPEVCQVGFYGGHFYSLVHTPQYKGYPAHFPVQGVSEGGSWFEKRNKDVHERGAKVVGHFNTTFLVGEPGTPEFPPPAPKGKEKIEPGPRGFFKFYTELWDEKELGPKPVADPMQLLARHADGTPMSSKAYSIGNMREWTACLNNPHWRTVLKAWAKRGIERGVDGYMINYFYRHNCLCEHCQKSFREHMSAKFTPEQMRKQFEITDIAKHPFTELVGWHNPKESTPLRREMLRWSQICCKQAFDDVFTHYARTLKPDLLTGQWNHLGYFAQIGGDERSMLPGDLWGRDESYLWYSTGGAACYSDLEEGYLGEGTLQARYIRGAFDDKPFTLGKYEQTRIRTAIAELAANGGAPMGFYTRHKDPMAAEEIARYYNFMEKLDHLYKGNKPHAEVLLLFPRSRVHQGDVESVDAFKKVGVDLLNQHVLFDVLPDEMATPARRAGYVAVIDPAKPADLPKGLSRFEGPTTVRVSASRPAAGNEITLHFVNYNRTEPEKKKSPGTGIKDEKPIAVGKVNVDFALPKGATVSKVHMLTPETPEPVELKFTVQGDRLKFETPGFLVYGVTRILLK